MANRDLTNFRSVITQVVENKDQVISAGAEIAENILRQGQEAKVTESVSIAQLDLSALQNQYQIDNQGDPLGGLAKYKQDRQNIFDTLGKGISPLYRRSWEENTRNIATRNDATQQGWALRQTRVNTVNHINNSMKNNFSQAGRDGEAFGASDDSEIDAFINFATSMEALETFGNGNLGEVTTGAMLGTYKEDYMKSFIAGVSEANPIKASKLMESDLVKEMFSDPAQYAEIKKGIDNRVLNFQKIAIEQEAIGALRSSAAVLNRSIKEPISQAEILALSADVSQPTKDYLMRLGGFKTGGTKLSNSEKMAEDLAITTSVLNFTHKKGIQSKDLQKAQDGVMSALNNGSINRTRATTLTNDYMIPYVDQVEENLSNFEFKKDNWFTDDVDVGFSQFQSEIEPMLIGFDEEIGEIDIEERTEGEIQFNNQERLKAYGQYESALRAIASNHNTTAAGIMKLPADKRNELLNSASVRAKTNYLIGRYPEIGNMKDNMPARFIGNNGNVIKTGLSNGKPTASVSGQSLSTADILNMSDEEIMAAFKAKNK